MIKNYIPSIQYSYHPSTLSLTQEPQQTSRSTHSIHPRVSSTCNQPSNRLPETRRNPAALKSKPYNAHSPSPKSPTPKSKPHKTSRKSSKCLSAKRTVYTSDWNKSRNRNWLRS